MIKEGKKNKHFDREGFSYWIDKNFIYWDKEQKSKLFSLVFNESFPNKLFEFSENLNSSMKTWFEWFFSKVVIFDFFHAVDKEKVLEKYEISREKFIIIFQNHLTKDDHRKFATNLYNYVEYKTDDIDFEIENQCLQNDIFSSPVFSSKHEWDRVFKNCRNENGAKMGAFFSLKGIRSFFLEFILIGLAISLSLVIFKSGNKIYNNYLFDKIDIYERNFSWLSKLKLFKADKKIVRSIKLKQNDLDTLDLENSDVDSFLEDKRDSPESEVLLFDNDRLPKAFSDELALQSKYEEIEKGGFRDKLYGTKKAFRIIINSVESSVVAEKIKEIMEKSSVRKFGRVKAGQQIPGGYYFNLYVRSEEMDRFIDETKKLGVDSKLFVSKTNTVSIRGHEKVFIWIKSI